MNRTERVKVIKESAALLAKRDWAEIDLILAQFGLETREDWPTQDKIAYSLEMMKWANDDDSLGEMHQYLTGHGELEGIVSGPHPWQDGGIRLFTSHLAKHQGDVGHVANWLAMHGVDAFVAHTSIEPSSEWQDVIESALRSCQAMAVFLHDGFHESLWCDQEVGFAMARQVPVLPLRYDLNPYGFMGKLQAERCAGLPDWQMAHKVMDWLMRTPSLQHAATDGLVSGFVNSRTFDNSRHLLLDLEEVQQFTPEQLNRLDEATTANSQIREAVISGTTVPKRIEQLISARGEKPSRDWMDDIRWP
jgi:TIR domain